MLLLNNLLLNVAPKIRYTMTEIAPASIALIDSILFYYSILPASTQYSTFLVNWSCPYIVLTTPTHH